MKLIKYGEKGCGKVEIEGDGKFVNFMFAEFKSSGPEHYAELYDDEGKLISTTKPHHIKRASGHGLVQQSETHRRT